MQTLVFAVLICLLLAAPAAALQLQTAIPAQSDAALVNPGMGLYLYGTRDPEDLPADAWYTPLIAIGYFRDDWADLEPDAESDYRFDEYFGPIFDLWVNKLHKRVSFRFMCSNMHSQREYVSPKWVFDNGVPFVVHKGLYVPRQVDPVFWDDRYLHVQEKFIADLGEYLDGRPGLEFIDIGSIGEWGEMHLSRWTPDELVATGYTDEKYIAAYRRIIDAFARAFPHTRVFLNVGDFDTINDYAALHHMHFRQDGLTPTGPSADVGNRFYRPYARRGVICNYEFHSGYDEMLRRGWGVRETFQKGLEDPISYLHLNVTSYDQLKDPPAELRDCILDAARRIGFRFALTQLQYNAVVHLDGAAPGRLALYQTWKNAGVAPCYDSYALRWSLVNAQGEAVVQTMTFPRQPTTLWWPGGEVSVQDQVTVPAATPPGLYRIKVEMLKPETCPELAERAGEEIQLALANSDAEGRYDLAEVRLERAPRRERVVYEETFARGASGWSAAPGVEMKVKGGEESALVLSGREPGQSWNYGSVRVDLLPFSRYRLSLWMKVDAISPQLPPYAKIGANAPDGRWLTNFNTNQYDLGKLGEWQLLVTYADTPGEAASGDLAIEKGQLETPVSATLQIRDVKLELLESP
jgi:hypothetical protein